MSPEEKKVSRTRAAEAKPKVVKSEAKPKATKSEPKAAKSEPKAAKPEPKAPRATTRSRAAASASTESAPADGNGAAPARGSSGSKRSNGSYSQPEYHGLRRRYRDEVAPALQREFGYGNTMQIPRVDKVVVNIGLGEAIANAKALDAAVGDLATITGQKPIVTRAKRSIAQFRLRTGMPIGAKVTLRGQRMYDFLERTMNLALPRIRDFRGIPTRSFDGRGNFTLGLKEQLVYPEIDYDKIDRLRGLEISIVTTAKTDEEGRKLLDLMGMPFQAT